MTTHAHFLRQLFLVQRLQSLRRAVPFDELRDYLLEQTSLRDLAADYSLRTFQRDLLMELLSLGDQVQVLAPAPLRAQLMQIHAAARTDCPG